MTKAKTVKEPKQIVVVTSGWVFLGVVTSDDNGNITIDHAENIRVWGTSKGLGEIALNGPTKDTVLDFYGTVLIPTNQVLYTLECPYSK